MTKDHDQFAREQALAREYEKKMADRESRIKGKVSQQITPLLKDPYEIQRLDTLFVKLYRPAFEEGRYERPSEFFRREMPWIYEYVIYSRFREAFDQAVDAVREYPYGVGWNRRSFRSDHYRNYANRIARILMNFRDPHNLDGDILDVLTGNLPEDALCYLKSRNTRAAGFAPEVLAFELDRENPELEAVVTDIINGDSTFSYVSRELIRGIVLSHNPRMHQLLCRLLLAARLQEGLRQAICEEADWGCKEAFLAILSAIREHDLIRYSSVKRAVGSWIGVISGETRDLDRISNKSLDLICNCVADVSFREASVRSEDAMAIHIALWSYGFDSIQEGIRVLNRIIASGTHHQVLTAGYFVNHLENPLLRHVAARDVLKSRREFDDILAVYLLSFIPAQNMYANSIAGDHHNPEINFFFESREQALEFCDWLMDVHNAMKEKERVFDPCIFPWYRASLKKTDLLEKAMVIAAIAQDRSRIDRLCGMISQCDAMGRCIYFNLLTKGDKTPAVRKAILDCLEDRNQDTRQVAFLKAKELELTTEEYGRIEGMLRLRYEDLRRNVMELLLKQPDKELQESIRRLLAASKTQIRTAGLDVITQLQKEPDRQWIANACMDAVYAISKPSSQEKILMDALLPKEREMEQEVLFAESDRYEPVVQLDDYSMECIRFFKEMFPHSLLEKQVLEGKTVWHTEAKSQKELCETANAAHENLKSLSNFVIAHEKDTFQNFTGKEFPVGTDIRFFLVGKEGGGMTAARMDLWQQWQEEHHINRKDLAGMLVASSGQKGREAYLLRCGAYISDLYGPGFETRMSIRYQEHVWAIAHELLYDSMTQEERQKLAMALGIWIARCLPDEMLLGGEGEPQQPMSGAIPQMWTTDDQLKINLLARQKFNGKMGHFIAHPQIKWILNKLEPQFDDTLKFRIPVLLNVFERSFAATAAYMHQQGNPVSDRVTLLLSQLYQESFFHIGNYKLPDCSTYLYARHFGLIGDRTLYYHLMKPGTFKNTLQLVTAVCVMRPEQGNIISFKAASWYHIYAIRNAYEKFVGKETTLSEEQLRLVELCKKTADRLVPIVVGAELNRGDMPAEYSECVTGIHFLSGMQTFVKILSALGKDSLDRSVYYWGSSQSKRGNLSHLLARCTPAPGEDANKLKELLKDTDITEKRLIEAALYSPAWIDIIGEYLGLPGFKSACYYFIAHMNERFDDQKKAIIARFTPLSEDELNLGAFDVNWFRSAYEQLGEANFDRIYDAAKYISDGAKHTRARKYADAALGRLNAAETEAAVQEKRNKDLLMAYAIIPLSGEEDLVHRFLYLQQFLKESRKFGAQRSSSEKKAVETALRNLATNAGCADSMRLTLRMETKLVENNWDLFKEVQVEQWNFRLLIDEQGNPEIQCTKDGKLLKSLPAKVKKDPYVLRLQEMKKQLKEQYRRTRRMFEQAMEDCTPFTLEEMRQLWCNPVVKPMVSKLIFKSGENFGLFDGEHLTDLEGTILEGNGEAELLIAHPFHLHQSGCWFSFQKYLYENKCVQPFRQVFRELYVKTKEELGSVTSVRYAGNQIQPRKAAACLRERRWVADVEMGLQKVYYQENIVATIFAMADWFTPADIEAPTLEHVAFFDRKTGQQLKIDEIPDVIFSEVMRDVDMAVSVAHAGGVDPETSHSTVEMRAAILSFTLPLLRLKNVRLEGSHAFIDGKLASYSVHLGSGIVHQIGGTMLNVLPVHAQHRGRIFLPFLDEDPKTAEVISKVILFAEDHKLKDPSILSQITQ